MGITGKYNFTGLQNGGRAIINALLASTTWGAAILASPFLGLFNFFEDLAINWLANRGLLIIDVGAIYINGAFDQAAFDQSFDDAINKAKVPGLTDAQKKVIDDAVISALDKFGRIGNT